MWVCLKSYGKDLYRKCMFKCINVVCIALCLDYWITAESNSQSVDIRLSHQQHLTSCHNNRYWLLAKCHLGSVCGSTPSQTVHTQFSVMSNTWETVTGLIFYFSASVGLIVFFRTTDSIYCLSLCTHQSPTLSHLARCLWHCFINVCIIVLDWSITGMCTGYKNLHSTPPETASDISLWKALLWRWK